MQVNANTLVKGLVANIEREKQFMNGVRCRVCDFNLPQAHAKEAINGTITTKDGAQIYHKDWASGQPVVFSHGWPPSGDAWVEHQPS